MDVLVALGTTAAYGYSVLSLLARALVPGYEGLDFLETSAMLIMFILLGKYLEVGVGLRAPEGSGGVSEAFFGCFLWKVMAKGKTSEAIGRLFQLAPTHAILVTLDKGEGSSASVETTGLC